MVTTAATALRLPRNTAATAIASATIIPGRRSRLSPVARPSKRGASPSRANAWRVRGAARIEPDRRGEDRRPQPGQHQPRPEDCDSTRPSDRRGGRTDPPPREQIGIKRYTRNPAATAAIEPSGIDLPGSRRSPDSPSPAMTPVTAGKRPRSRPKSRFRRVGAWSTTSDPDERTECPDGERDQRHHDETPSARPVPSSARSAPVTASTPTPTTITSVTGISGRFGHTIRNDSASP